MLGPDRCTFCDGTEGGNPPVVLTVRAWFRLQRGAMWTAHHPCASEIDRLAYLIDFSHSRCPYDIIDGFVGVVISEEWHARQRAAREEAPAALVKALDQAYIAAGLCRPGTYASIERRDEILKRFPL